MKSGHWDMASPVDGELSARERDRQLQREEHEARLRMLAPPVPPTILSQSAGRERRRAGGQVQYTSDFDLGAEVSAVCRPLAAAVSSVLQVAPLPGRRVTRDSWRVALRDEVEAVAAEVHNLFLLVARLIGERGRVSVSARAHIERQVRAGAGAPALFDEQLIDGSWPEVLAAYVAPLSAELGAVLDAHPAADGFTSAVSDELREALCELDFRGSQLQGRVPEVRRWQQAIRDAEAAGVAHERKQQARQLAGLGLK